MNNKLEDLLYQSGLTAQGCWDEMDDYAKAAIEKFAELIVLECAKIGNHAHDGGEYPDKMFKECFGVE